MGGERVAGRAAEAERARRGREADAASGEAASPARACFDASRWRLMGHPIGDRHGCNE